MPGDSVDDAVQALASHILDIYEALKTEAIERLGDGPRQQLETLRAYIREL